MLDRTPDGGWTPGGPALYAARMAVGLGAETALVTRLPDGYPANALDGLAVHALPARDVPRYVNTYDREGNRTQLLLSEGEPVPAEAILDIGATDVLVLAPAFHELAEMPAVDARVRAVSLQGVLRALEGECVIRVQSAWEACAAFVTPGTLCFFSDEDTGDPIGLARRIAMDGATALLTHGQRGATLFRAGSEDHASAFESNAVELTGAGDAFAVAFTVRFAETGDNEAALNFALMAGALAVEGVGLEGLPSRAAIEARLARVAA